jgi:ABC-2 type transport system permease protein/oleandomycin transport system permease protein
VTALDGLDLSVEAGTVFGYDLLLAFVPVLSFAYAFSWISASVGLMVRDPETAQSAGFLWVLPLTFVSSAFVPTDSMPGAGRRSPTPTR